MADQQIVKICLGLFAAVSLVMTASGSGKTDFIPTQAQRIELLTAHNNWRSNFPTLAPGRPQPPAANMNRMYWSVLLEATAIDWASQCKSLAHGDTAMKNGTAFQKFLAKYGYGFGQNVYWSSDQPTNYTDIVANWASEIKFFTFQSDSAGTCTVTDPNDSCGHYTQVIWANTVFVGCGVANCGSFWQAYCNYASQGNYIGVAPYKSGDPCNQCGSAASGFADCERNLCVPEDKCSPVTDCTVADRDNCLCSEGDINKIVSDLLNKT